MERIGIDGDHLLTLTLNARDLLSHKSEREGLQLRRIVKGLVKVGGSVIVVG